MTRDYSAAAAHIERKGARAAGVLLQIYGFGLFALVDARFAAMSRSTYLAISDGRTPCLTCKDQLPVPALWSEICFDRFAQIVHHPPTREPNWPKPTSE